MQSIKRYLQKHALISIIFAFSLGIFISIGTVVMNAFTSTPEFCGTCHSMEEVKNSFLHSTHRGQNCTECHLPHDNIAIYAVEKGRSGMTDFYHEMLGDYEEPIKLSDRGKNMVNRNCIRCHFATFEKVHADIEGKGNNCLKCHRRIAHGRYKAN